MGRAVKFIGGSLGGTTRYLSEFPAVYSIPIQLSPRARGIGDPVLAVTHVEYGYEEYLRESVDVYRWSNPTLKTREENRELRDKLNEASTLATKRAAKIKKLKKRNRSYERLLDFMTEGGD